jgi:hypothetical protein
MPLCEGPLCSVRMKSSVFLRQVEHLEDFEVRWMRSDTRTGHRSSQKILIFCPGDRAQGHQSAYSSARLDLVNAVLVLVSTWCPNHPQN